MDEHNNIRPEPCPQTPKHYILINRSQNNAPKCRLRPSIPSFLKAVSLIHCLIGDYTDENSITRQLPTKMEGSIAPLSPALPVPAERFPKFRRLPAEVRVMIWELAMSMPAGRHLELIPRQRAVSSPSLPANEATLQKADHPWRLPNILNVNRESRKVAEKVYTIFKPSTFGIPIAAFQEEELWCFAPGQDTVYFHEEDLREKELAKNWLKMLNEQLPGGLRSIQCVECRGFRGYSWENYDLYDAEDKANLDWGFKLLPLYGITNLVVTVSKEGNLWIPTVESMTGQERDFTGWFNKFAQGGELSEEAKIPKVTVRPWKALCGYSHQIESDLQLWKEVKDSANEWTEY